MSGTLTSSHPVKAAGCREYQHLSRRGFLGVSGAAALAAAAPAWLPRVAMAASHRSTMRDVVISVYLRGACDGLTMVVPHADPEYYAARPRLSVPRPDSGGAYRCTDLDGFFGLHPAMLPLVPSYQDGRLLFVHASGLTDPTRSHFDAQRFMEVGAADDVALLSGWLGRHLGLVPPMTPGALLRGVGLNTGLMRTLVGAPRTLPIPDPDAFDLGGRGATYTLRRSILRDVYTETQGPLRTAALDTIQTIDLLNTIDFDGYVPEGGAIYPAGDFGSSLRSAAALIKAQIGVEAIAVDLHGWDTHVNQGNESGVMAGLLSELARGLAAFDADMSEGSSRATYVLVCMSEFGRRVEENGSSGTDHGHGNCMMVLGSAVRGGRVMCQWPGLAPEHRFEGLDLDVTIDYRDVLAEIVSRRLGGSDLAQIFPRYSPRFRGVVE